MAAALLDGKATAQLETQRTQERTEALAKRGIQPGLATVLVGDDPASRVYVSGKRKSCKRLGMASFDADLPADTPHSRLLAVIAELAADPRVHGILVQLPLPPQIDEREILEAIPPGKDVDGFHPENVGLLAMGRPRVVPCTTLGIFRLMERAGIRLEGRDAVVVGRSNLVGKPTALLLTAAHATVTVCHTRTRALHDVIRRSDLVVAAMGRAEAIRGEWIREGAVVIDVGISRVDGRLVGDVEFGPASQRAAWITPVPGGVGPMTIAMLMENTVALAEASAGPERR